MKQTIDFYILDEIKLENHHIIIITINDNNNKNDEKDTPNLQ